jgi:DNA modification methylase
VAIQNDSLSEKELAALWSDCLNNLWGALKPGGVIYATVPARPLHLVFASGLKEREALRQVLLWLKDSMVMGHSDYHYKHEPILYGWKPGAAHYSTSDRTKTSVLEHDRPKRSQEHPTMKPLSLWGELIVNSSRKGEVVFDPFLGSGTTLIACEQLARVCYGMEIEPKYCEVIINRYHKFCQDNGRPFVCKINGENYTPISIAEI